ncbi:putative DNA recombinase [Wolbachia endosymbiont of Armadillidium vulgare str. wVulC]|uniref:Uncharacterized protein n=1 Tax=Wolbachia endosymbiont of Armadillidium arcangelii TaxID=3158571 RepID=A0AAU7Q288_9RICK|nr:hypothetical protein [Wolbachia endosymbiont of Armadillidium vulgare]KLT22439.1 putative DNA recombinase [Wolbachia endosymbiont of Armadillidium vulgare str. wVulC]OJH32823.1 Recombinase [Wolbachia endosymbiont of Armadillidium vulgare]
MASLKVVALIVIKRTGLIIPVPKIINENLFDSVQAQLAENRQRARVRQRRETYLLQGLMVCQHNQTREKQESKLRLSIKKFIDSYAKGFISQEEFEPRITTMKQHLKEIEEEKEKVLDQKKLQQELSLVTDSLKNFSSSVESKLDLVDWQTKQNIIRMLIHQIEINHNHLYIVFRIKSLANLDQNRHNKIMQCCTSRTDTGIQRTDQAIRTVHALE